MGRMLMKLCEVDRYIHRFSVIVFVIRRRAKILCGFALGLGLLI
jgi:hypothetical protein